MNTYNVSINEESNVSINEESNVSINEEFYIFLLKIFKIDEIINYYVDDNLKIINLEIKNNLNDRCFPNLDYIYYNNSQKFDNFQKIDELTKSLNKKLNLNENLNENLNGNLNENNITKFSRHIPSPVPIPVYKIQNKNNRSKKSKKINKKDIIIDYRYEKILESDFTIFKINLKII